MKKKIYTLFFMINLFIFVLSGVVLAAEEWSGTQAGLTLTTDVQLVGDTYMTSTITIPKSTVITIDLNGYMLHGPSSGTIIDNKGQLTIKDSRPDHRKS